MISSNNLKAKSVKLLKNLRFELFPSATAGAISTKLPSNSLVSVTCSQQHGLAETQKLSEVLLARGHVVIPHFAARMVQGKQHAIELANWTKSLGIKKVFIIAGDYKNPCHYVDSLLFMEDFLAAKPGVSSVGFPVYPDGHTLIQHADLVKFAMKKQSLLMEHDVQGEAVSQLCFDEGTVIQWLSTMREVGFQVPLYVGIPGSVNMQKLLSFAMSIGVGKSIASLSNNPTVLRNMYSLMKVDNYDPTPGLNHYAEYAESLNIAGVHCFTFNAVDDTSRWVTDTLGNAR